MGASCWTNVQCRGPTPHTKLMPSTSQGPCDSRCRCEQVHHAFRKEAQAHMNAFWPRHGPSALRVPPDGLHIHSATGEERASQPPVHADALYLMLQMYWPCQPIPGGDWQPPAIERFGG